MNFVSVDVVVDAADSLYHCCYNVVDDLVCREDDRVYLKSKYKNIFIMRTRVSF